jgi:hypothetical protein
MGLKFNFIYQLLVYADVVNLLGDNMETIKQNIEAVVGASKEAGVGKKHISYKMYVSFSLPEPRQNHVMKISY